MPQRVVVPWRFLLEAALGDCSYYRVYPKTVRRGVAWMERSEIRASGFSPDSALLHLGHVVASLHGFSVDTALRRDLLYLYDRQDRGGHLVRRQGLAHVHPQQSHQGCASSRSGKGCTKPQV